MKLLLVVLIATTLLKPVFTLANVSGEISGFSVRNNDNVFNFALALPVLTKEQILNFNLDMFLSPENETISALGQSIEVPSNLSIPQQRERYIFSIRFNKPNYRLPWDQPTRMQAIGALEGQFPFKEVIDKVRGGSPIFSLINDFTFNSFTVQEVRGPFENIRVGQTQHTHIMRLNGLTADNSPFMTLAIALDSTDDMFYFPIDLKLLSLADSDPLRVTLNSQAMLAIVPKEIFSAATLKNQNMELPFSIVWSAKRENSALPILTNLVEVSSSGIQLNAQDISQNHRIAGYKVNLFDAAGRLIYEDVSFGALPNSIKIPQGVTYKKLRFDVFATDDSLTPTNEDDLIKATDYLSRYEKNLY